MGKTKKKKQKRALDICVISDIHLGTYGCRAPELLHYLKSINPKLLILNGDIFDVWNFKKNYFPETHMEIIRRFLKMAENGTQIVYITGNHDEVFRKFTPFKLGNFHLVDKYIFTVGGKTHWAFHGDIFDATTKGYAKILAKLGGKGYDLLIWFNRLVNDILDAMGKERMSLSKKIKYSVKKAVAFVDNFEKTAAELAIDEGYDVVLCGHIHQQKDETIHYNGGTVRYLNSGDWIENLTALEYFNHQWVIYQADNKKEIIEVEYEEQESSIEQDKKIEELIGDIRAFVVQ